MINVFVVFAFEEGLDKPDLFRIIVPFCKTTFSVWEAVAFWDHGRSHFPVSVLGLMV